MSITITGGFTMYTGTNTKALFFNDTYQVADDLTVVRGNHQFGIGGNVQYWKGDYTSSSRANGNWIWDGSATGLGLADLLVGRVTSVEHGGSASCPSTAPTWASRTDLARDQPRHGQRRRSWSLRNETASFVFNMENSRSIKSKVFSTPGWRPLRGREGFPKNERPAGQWWEPAARRHRVTSARPPWPLLRHGGDHVRRASQHQRHRAPLGNRSLIMIPWP
jgi:hypothetical protein